jgi:hypothetical protein
LFSTDLVHKFLGFCELAICFDLIFWGRDIQKADLDRRKRYMEESTDVFPRNTDFLEILTTHLGFWLAKYQPFDTEIFFHHPFPLISVKEDMAFSRSCTQRCPSTCFPADFSSPFKSVVMGRNSCRRGRYVGVASLVLRQYYPLSPWPYLGKRKNRTERQERE